VENVFYSISNYKNCSQSLSEFEFIVSHFHVIWLREFVLESRNKFRVDLYQELSNLRHSSIEVRFFVVSEFLQFFGPAVDFLELLA